MLLISLFFDFACQSHHVLEAKNQTPEWNVVCAALRKLRNRVSGSSSCAVLRLSRTSSSSGVNSAIARRQDQSQKLRSTNRIVLGRIARLAPARQPLWEWWAKIKTSTKTWTTLLRNVYPENLRTSRNYRKCKHCMFNHHWTCREKGKKIDSRPEFLKS